MSAAPAPAKPKKRIVPTSTVAPTVAAAPTAAAAPAPAVAAAPAASAPTVAAPVAVPLNDRIRSVLTELRDDLDALLTSPFAPQTRDVDGLDANVCALRAAIQRAEADAAAAKRAAEAERARLARELQPVRIERNQATKPLYRKYASATSNETRFLYRCPLADEATGVCTHGNPSRPATPAARSRILRHIANQHLGKDKLREHRRSDAFWSEGAEETRARARNRGGGAVGGGGSKRKASCSSSE